MQRHLTEVDYQRASADLLCDVIAIKAVCNIEAPRGFFNPDGTPVILFERHYFHRLTGGKYSKTHPSISNPKGGGYGKYSEQHKKLQLATELDREAALQSCSWGGFQIMGANYRKAGFQTLQAFVNAMYAGAEEHLDAFVAFIRADRRLVAAIRDHDWHTFAEIYNGPGQDSSPGVIHDHDFRIAQEFDRLQYA